MNFRELLRAGQAFLEERGIPPTEPDAWYLLEYMLSTDAGDERNRIHHRIDRGWYLLHQSDSVPEELSARYRELLAVRGRHVPLQHITGEQEFMGLTFRVNGDVLIPRQDTELLVEEARKVIKPGSRVLDVCTGSGCILISLLKLCEKRVGEDNSPSDGGYGCPGGTLAEEQRDKIQAMACDLSEKALAVAKENAARLGVQIDFRQGDLFEPAEGVFDLIVSNPPYIPTEDIGGLMEEVRAYDPSMALDGGLDGLDFYRRITREAPGYLKDGGWLMVEIGCEQAQKVSEMMREQGFIEISIVKDLAGLDRVVRAKWPEDGL